MIVVIGHFPEYLATAAAINAGVFTISTAEWAALDDAARWDRNRAFLDAVIAQAAQIILATNPRDIRRPSYLAKEIEYLISRGYKIVLIGDQWKLVCQ